MCDRAITFAEARGPWLALRTAWKSIRDPRTRTSPVEPIQNGDGTRPRLRGEPVPVAREQSASACFQWGLLWSSKDRKDRAIEWLDQAVWLDWSNYWYQFYLAYPRGPGGAARRCARSLQRGRGPTAGSAWVRFDRARLYRTKGRWSWALDDLIQARKGLEGRSESRQVAGIGSALWHSAISQGGAREYEKIVREAPNTRYARAPRLNLANIAAESGREEVAAAAYESLLREEPADGASGSACALEPSAWPSQGALADLEVLLDSERNQRKRAELLSSRPSPSC